MAQTAWFLIKYLRKTGTTMKKYLLLLALISGAGLKTLSAQEKSPYSAIDMMLIRGEYERVIDTCRLILAADSANDAIFYKMGLAYQNILPDDRSMDCFQSALEISPENKLYKFMVAKGFYGKGKNKLAEPLFSSLLESDTLNWAYAYHLTSIYMQDGRYDESARIYSRFLRSDSSNYMYLDKLGFAMLRMGELEKSKELFSRSLEINGRNTNAIKNLAYLYTMTFRADTALTILTRGIGVDPSDMDLYVRRAALHFSINYNKRALNDYLTILASGDSTTLFLKRAGIGYANNLQPGEAIRYLTLAYKKDTTDVETLTYLAQSYNSQDNTEKALLFYEKAAEAIKPSAERLGITYVMMAETQKTAGQYRKAIETYLKALKYINDPNLYMIIGNLYDEKLNNPALAIRYYQLFLDNLKNARMAFSKDYVESVRKRVEYLKNPPPPKKD
jgi:tetratricopeptide (TPR) repeat protein